MRYLVFVCLALTLGGCSSTSTAPYVGVDSYEPAVDLGWCARSPIVSGHEDKLCGRQNATIY